MRQATLNLEMSVQLPIIGTIELAVHCTATVTRSVVIASVSLSPVAGCVHSVKNERTVTKSSGSSTAYTYDNAARCRSKVRLTYGYDAPPPPYDDCVHFTCTSRSSNSW